MPENFSLSRDLFLIQKNLRELESLKVEQVGVIDQESLVYGQTAAYEIEEGKAMSIGQSSS